MIKIPENFFFRFWEMTEKNDMKRIASQTPTDGIKALCDIPYLDDGKKEHLLDVYYPEERENEVLPLIIDIHGGGWMYGYKEINKYYCYYLASKGFRVISVNYGLCPQYKVNNQVQDIFTALNWIDENLENYNCDRKNIFVAGDSAGGHLGAIVVSAMSRQDMRDVFEIKRPSFDFTAAGFICGAFDIDFILKLGLAGEYAKIMLGEDYSISKYHKYVNMSDVLKQNTELPPIWMVSSKEDFIGFLSKKFDKCLSEHGKYHVFKRWGKSDEHPLPHVFCVTNPEYVESIVTNDEMTAFFKKYIRH